MSFLLPLIFIFCLNVLVCIDDEKDNFDCLFTIWALLFEVAFLLFVTVEQLLCF